MIILNGRFYTLTLEFFLKKKSKKKIIQDLIEEGKEKTSQGSKWYLIPNDWWDMWCQYVGYNGNLSSQNSQR